MNIQSEVERIQAGKLDMKAALQERGVDAGDARIDEYGKFVRRIQTGAMPIYITLRCEVSENTQIYYVDLNGILQNKMCNVTDKMIMIETYPGSMILAVAQHGIARAEVFETPAGTCQLIDGMKELNQGYPSVLSYNAFAFASTSSGGVTLYQV